MSTFLFGADVVALPAARYQQAIVEEPEAW